MSPPLDVTRRRFLELAALGAGVALVGCEANGTPPGGSGDAGPTADADPLLPDATPECAETEDNIEGPFYKAGAPMRDDLTEVGLEGTPLELTGRVMSLAGGACTPLGGAVLDFWQSDFRDPEPAVYDNATFRLRGKITTAADGSYRLRTIVPGHYLNGPEFRPAHIHVKVSAPGHPLLTTQLYFAGDPYNDSDPFIHPALIMTLQDSEGGDGSKRARFDFALRGA